MDDIKIRQFIEQARAQGISEQDAMAYLQRTGRVAAPVVAQEPEQKGLGRELVETFVEPFTKYGGYVAEAVAQGGRTLFDPTFRKLIFQGPEALTEEEIKRVSQMEKATIIPEEIAGFEVGLKDEDIASRKDIAMTGLKRTAAAEAMLLPAGSTYKTAAALGAVSGAGLAFAEDEDIGKGALYGGIGGPVGRAFGKVLQRGAGVLRETGEELIRGVRGMNRLGGGARFVETERVVQNTLDSLGITGSARAQLEKMPGAMDDLNKMITERLQANKGRVNVSNVRNHLQQIMDDSPWYNSLNKQQRTYFEQEMERLLSKRVGGAIPQKDIFDFKLSLGKRIKNAFRVAEGELSRDMTNKEAAWYPLWQGLDDLIAGRDPVLKALTTTQSHIHKAVESGLLKKAGAKNVSIASFLVSGLRIPGTGRGGQALSDKIGRSLVSIADGMEDLGLQKLFASAPPATTYAGRTVGASMAGDVDVSELGETPPDLGGVSGEAPAGGVQTGGVSGGIDITDTQEGQEQGRISEDKLWQWNGAAWIPTPAHIQLMMVRDFQSTGGKNFSKIKALSSAISTDTGNLSLSDGAIEKISDSTEALALVQTLKSDIQSGEVQTGPGVGVSALSPLAIESRASKQQIATVRQKVGKALEGGVLRKEDEEKYKNILATIWDRPELAMQKLDTLEGMLERDLRRYVEMQKMYGKGANQPTSGIQLTELRGE